MYYFTKLGMFLGDKCQGNSLSPFLLLDRETGGTVVKLSVVEVELEP